MPDNYDRGLENLTAGKKMWRGKIVDRYPWEKEPEAVSVSMEKPEDAPLDMDAFAELFAAMSQSYKLFWFRGILEGVRLGKDEQTFDEIVNRMASDAWDLVLEHRLSLGMADAVERLVLAIKADAGLPSDSSPSMVISALEESRDKEVIKLKQRLIQYVPFRLLAPFFKDGWQHWDNYDKTIERINSDPGMLYSVQNGKGLSAVIKIRPQWMKYLVENEQIVSDWAEEHLIRYLMNRNPKAKNISEKVYKPMRMDDMMEFLAGKEIHHDGETETLREAPPVFAAAVQEEKEGEAAQPAGQESQQNAFDEKDALELIDKHYSDHCVFHDDYLKMPQTLGARYFEMRSWCRARGFQDIRSWLKQKKIYKPVERDLRTGPELELNAEDDAVTVARKIYESRPLIGDVVLSETDKAKVNEYAQRVFDRIQAGETASAEDDLVLVLAIILILRKSQGEEENGEDEEEDTFWESIYKQFGYRKEDSSQRVYAALRWAIQSTLIGQRRYLAPQKATQRYYTSLMLHALAPLESMESLFEILFYFFTDEMDYIYIPEDPVFKSIVNCIAYRWDKAVEKDQNITVRSNTIASGLKILFQDRQGYMTQLCEQIIRKIDALIQNPGASPLRPDSYMDIQLENWYRKKIDWLNKQLNQDRPKSVRSRSVSSAERAQIRYIMDEKRVSISVPAIRLETVADEEPEYRIYQNDRLAASGTLDVYGRFCWTIRQAELSLEDCGIDLENLGSLRFIIHYNGEDIIDTRNKLYRDYMIFDRNGREIPLQSVRTGQYHILVPDSADVRFSEDIEELLLDHPGKLYEVYVQEQSSVRVNGIELNSSQRGKESFHHFSQTERVNGVKARYGENEFSIYTQTPQISFSLPENVSPQQYRIRVDGQDGSLDERCGINEDMFTIRMPYDENRIHLIQMIDWRNAKVVYEYRFVVMNHFRCELEKEIYTDDGMPVKGVIQYGNERYEFETLPEPDEDFVIIQAGNLEYEIKIILPMVRCAMGEENLLSRERTVWYEEISKDNFITVTVPHGWNRYLLYNGREVRLAAGSDKLFDFGNFEESARNNKAEASVDLLLKRGDGAVTHYHLMTIVYKPKIIHTLLRLDDNRSLWWDPVNNVICDKQAKFRLVIHATSRKGKDSVYSLGMEANRIDESFPYDLGVFKYEVWLRGKRTMFKTTEDQLIYTGALRIGSDEEIRLYGKVIHLVAARRCEYFDGFGKRQMENISLPLRSGWLSRFDYQGQTESPLGDGEKLPTFTASMYFYDPQGRKTYFNSDENSDKYEQINPVTIWMMNEHLLYLLSATGDTVLIDKRYNSIVNRKLLLSKQVENEIVRTPDLFEYNVTEEPHVT